MAGRQTNNAQGGIPSSAYYGPGRSSIQSAYRDSDQNDAHPYRPRRMDIGSLVGASVFESAAITGPHMDIPVYDKLEQNLRAIETKFHAGQYDAQAMPLVRAFLDEMEVLAKIQVERNAIQDERLSDIKAANAAAFNAVCEARAKREEPIDEVREFRLQSMSASARRKHEKAIRRQEEKAARKEKRRAISRERRENKRDIKMLKRQEKFAKQAMQGEEEHSSYKTELARRQLAEEAQIADIISRRAQTNATINESLQSLLGSNAEAQKLKQQLDENYVRCDDLFSGRIVQSPVRGESGIDLPVDAVQPTQDDVEGNGASAPHDSSEESEPIGEERASGDAPALGNEIESDAPEGDRGATDDAAVAEDSPMASSSPPLPPKPSVSTDSLPSPPPPPAAPPGQRASEMAPGQEGLEEESNNGLPG